MKIIIPAVHSLPVPEERDMKRDVHTRRVSLRSQETNCKIAIGLHKENKIRAVFLHPAMEKGSPMPQQHLNVGVAGQKGTENLGTCFKSIFVAFSQHPYGKGVFPLW